MEEGQSLGFGIGYRCVFRVFEYVFNAWELLAGLPTDAQTLESGDGVQFFCRTCSCQLTNAPFRYYDNSHD